MLLRNVVSGKYKCFLFLVDIKSQEPMMFFVHESEIPGVIQV